MLLFCYVLALTVCIDRSSHAAVSHASSEHVFPRYNRSTPSDNEIPTTLRRLDINAQSARVTVRRRATGSPTWHPYSSESESSCGKSPTPRVLSAVQRSEAEPEAWTRYARAVETDGSSAMFVCIWSETKDGRASPCGYQSKKHLVKRHVESKHLQIKYVTSRFPISEHRRIDNDIRTMTDLSPARSAAKAFRNAQTIART